MDLAQQRPPDFTQPGFAGLVELTMAEELLNREEAIELLNQNWAARGAAGLQPDRGGGQRPPNNNPQEDRQPNEGDNAQREQQHQPAEPRLRSPTPGREVDKDLITFDVAARVASTLASRPADYAIKRLNDKKHVPLWYFTREGLREAARSVRHADENETLAITQAAEGNMTVRAANSLTASKNAKLDHCLIYAEYMFAKNHFLTAIENVKWGNEALDAFNWFFHNLDNHQLREEGDCGERALLHYASQVRLDWHDKLMLGKAYNIGIINEELLAKIACKLDARDVKTGLDQACTSPLTFLNGTNLTSTPPFRSPPPTHGLHIRCCHNAGIGPPLP